MKVLDLAAWCLYGYSSAQATDGEEGERLLDVSLWFGYMLQVNLDGWQLFCEGHNLDPDPFTANLPGEKVLDLAARLAEERDPFAAEEALACLLRHNLPATAATTAEDVAAGLKKSFEFLADWWG